MSVRRPRPDLPPGPYLVVGLALGVAVVAMPPGKIGSAHSENMVMAEMTTIDAEHEPEG